jgi:dCTP deaminase
MSILSDGTLRKRLMSGSLGVSPVAASAIQPASIDLTLGDTLRTQPYGTIADPEVDQSELWDNVSLCTDGRWRIGGFRLYHGATFERIRMPNDCLGLLSGISTLGRLGLMPHVQAGLVDPGWVGNLTLEIMHLGQGAYLRPGMRIAQLTLYQLDRAAEQPYHGRYQNDDSPVPARLAALT